jgi:uncharacterized membrane protein YfcA
MVYVVVSVIILAASFLFAMLGLGGGMIYTPALIDERSSGLASPAET